MDLKSVYGFRRDSPFRGNPYLDIQSPEGLIDMSQTDMPIMAMDETGYSKLLSPRSGMHQFKGKTIREIPMRQKGGYSRQDLYDFLFDDEEEEPPVTAPDEDEVEQALPEKQPLPDTEYDMAMQIATESMPEYRRSGRTRVGAYTNVNVLPIDTDAGAEQAFQYYQKRGLQPHVAAGIVGNLVQESGLNPYARGDNGLATGVAQWHPDRFQGLKDWAKSQNRDPYALDTQLDYVLIEANQRGDLARVNATSNSGEAAHAFAKHYERPKVIDQKRIGYARSLNPYRQGGYIK